MKVKNDRRSQRTHQALGDALFELMKERGYETLSIKDIIERANVGRSTFYAHYADKEELFVSQMDQVIESLHQDVPHHDSEGNPYFPSLGLFQHLGEQWKLYKILSWEGGIDLLARQLQKSISDQIEEHFVAGGQEFEAPVPVIANFLAGSFISTLKWWLDNKMIYPPEQINEIFCKLALPGVTQVASKG